MFQPVIPLTGFGGWNFLQSTYSRQLENFSSAPQIANDRAYMVEKMSEPISVETFLDDRRLMRVTMTAFGLEGEEWKRGFVDKVLQEVADPESNFLVRLNNPNYTAFAEALSPQNGQIFLNSSAVADIATKFETQAFQSAVGEIDNDMRLSLNYQNEIVDLVGAGSSDDAILFRLLGSVPVRTVLEGALNLPSDIRQLPIDKQAEMLDSRLKSTLGVSSLDELTSLESIDRVLQRFHAIQSLNQGSSSTSSGSVALTLLNSAAGVGAIASQNLLLSRIG